MLALRQMPISSNAPPRGQWSGINGGLRAIDYMWSHDQMRPISVDDGPPHLSICGRLLGNSIQWGVRRAPWAALLILQTESQLRVRSRPVSPASQLRKRLVGRMTG